MVRQCIGGVSTIEFDVATQISEGRRRHGTGANPELRPSSEQFKSMTNDVFQLQMMRKVTVWRHSQ